MQTKLKILGFSEAALCMIFDILESNNTYPYIEIINNLNITPTKEYINPSFIIREKNQLDDSQGSFLIGAAKKETKIKIREFFKGIPDEKFIPLISKHVNISSTTSIDKGVIINTNVCIAAHSKIGKFVFINRGCTIGHHTTIGDFTTINPAANIAGNVKIGKNCQIGMGANIIDGITIGDNVIIGAGSLVTKDIPNDVTAYGVPCKIVR